VPGNNEHESMQVTAVLELYAAICDGRVTDVLALTSPEVDCEPLVRPGLSRYQGHAGMVGLVRDMHAAHGSYHVTIIEVSERPGTEVIVRARISPEAGRGQPLAVTTTYLFQDDLISQIASLPDDQAT
jgi:SnoaL-like domain